MTKRRPWSRKRLEAATQEEEKRDMEAQLEEGFNQEARRLKEERNITLYRARLLAVELLMAEPEIKAEHKEWLEHKLKMIEFDHNNKNEPKGDTVDQLLSSLYPIKED